MSDVIAFPPRLRAVPKDTRAEQAALKCLQIERMAYAISALADTPQREYRAMHIAHLAKWLADEFDNTPPGGHAA